MADTPSFSYRGNSSSSLPFGSNGHQPAQIFGQQPVVTADYGAAIPIPPQGMMDFGLSDGRPPFAFSTSLPNTQSLLGSGSSFGLAGQPSLQFPPLAGPSLFGHPSSQQPSRSTSPFSAFAPPNHAAPPMPTASPIPFSTQAAPSESAPVFNPFAVKPIENPFTTSSGKQPAANGGQPQGGWENGSNKSPFSRARPTNGHSTTTPLDKTAVVENKPTPNGVSDKPVPRQTRFTKKTDIGTMYQEAIEERAKRRERLIKDGTIDNPAVPKYLDQAIAFHGTCTTMCPRFEFLQRRHQKMVDNFELDGEGNPNESLFVKSFHRPAAGMDAPLPEDVRTPKALVETLRYLVFNIVKNSPWSECHGFVRDRTRSIRQDFTYQNYDGEEAVTCTEIIARFHILALHMISESPDHQEYMELEQLDKSLTTLGFIYLDGQVPDADGKRKVFPNEPEFRAYTILRHLRDRYVEKDDMKKWPTEVVRSKQVQHALRIYQAVQRYERASDYGFHAQHYVKTFFELFRSKDTDFITACLLQVYFPEIRRYSLKIMAENYMKTSKMTSMEFVKDFLCYESLEQAESEIRHYGLSIAQHMTDGVPFSYVVTGKGQFDVDAPKIRTQPHPSLLDPKRKPETQLTDILWGSEHKVRTCSTLLAKDENALVDGKCQDIETYFRFGEAEEFFNFPEATAGEYGAAGGPSEHGAEFGAHGGSASLPLSAASTTTGLFDAPPSEKSKPPTLMGNSTNGFTAPVVAKSSSPFSAQNAASPFSSTPFSSMSTSVFPSSSEKLAPAFSRQSITNPFAPPPDKATISTTNGTFGQKPSSPFFTQTTATSSHVDDKPLFLSNGEALSDEEEEEEGEDEGPVAPPSLPSWTSFLPNSSSTLGSTSLLDTSPAPFSSQFGAASVFDKRPAPPATTFQFTSPVPAQPKAKASPSETHSIQHASSPFSSGATPGVFASSQPENKNSSIPASKVVKAAPQGVDVDEGHEELSARSAREEAIARREREEGELARRMRELKEAAERERREREEAMEEKAQAFFNRHLMEKFFYIYEEQTRRRIRRTNRALRQQHRAAYAEDPQWWPIIKDGSLYKDSVQKVSQLVFRSAELELSIPEIVHLALAESQISHATYRMLLHNNDRSGKSEYWFQQKFLGTSREIFVANPDTGNEFHAQPTVTQQEAPEVGFLVFGCSSNFSVSNEERFSVDRNNLHFIVDYLARNSSFSRLAVLVICYRSPMDDEPADPNGLDSSRTLGKARRERVESVKAALNFSFFPRTVVGKKVVMVETLRDLDLSHELRMFAEDYILETVSPRYSGDDDGSPNDAAARKAITAPVNRKKGGIDGEVVRRKAQGSSPGHSPEGRKRRRAVVHNSPRTPVPASRSTAVKRTGDSVVQDSPYKRYCRKKREQGVLDNAKMRMKALIGFSMVLQSPTASNDNDQSPPLSLQSAPSPDAPSPPRPHPSPRPSQAQQEVDTATANAKIKNRVDRIVEDADKTTAEILKFFSENE